MRFPTADLSWDLPPAPAPWGADWTSLSCSALFCKLGSLLLGGAPRGLRKVLRGSCSRVRETGIPGPLGLCPPSPDPL